MRGTGYAVTEIILWMVAAGLVGLAIGWILRSVIGGGARLEESEAKLEKEKERYSQISSELGEWKRKADKLERKVEESRSELDSSKELTAQLEEDLTAARVDVAGVEDLEQSLAATRADLDAAAARASDVEGKMDSVVTAKEAEIQRLSGEVAGLGGLQAAIADRDARLVKLGEELSELRGQHAGCGIVADEHTGTIAALEARLAARDAELQRLQSGPTGGSGESTHQAALEDAAAVEAEAVQPVQLSWQEGTTALGTPGDTHADDLRVINGIGKKLQAMLNGFGIRSWEQVAALTADDIARVDDALDFPGRVERDQWVEQANGLVARFPDRDSRPTRKTLHNEAPE